MPDTSMIRLALSIQQRNRQQQQEDAQRQFLQHVAKTLPGKGQPVTFSYADILFRGEGKESPVSEKEYIQSRIDDGVSETEAKVQAGTLFKQRTRMVYATEDMLAIQAHGQSLGLPHTAIGALTETVTGDAFVGMDDMRRSLLQEANQLSGWMRGGGISRSLVGQLKQSEQSTEADLSGGGRPAEPARLTSAYLKSQGLDLSQLGDSEGARVFAGSSPQGQDMILNAMGAWGTPPEPGGQWSLEARNPGAQGSMYGEILDAIGGRLNQFETTKARGTAGRHGLGLDLSGEDVDRAIDKGMAPMEAPSGSGEPSGPPSGAQQIQDAIEPRLKVQQQDRVSSFLRQEREQRERLFNPGRAAESDRLSAINRLLQYAGGR